EILAAVGVHHGGSVRLHDHERFRLELPVGDDGMQDVVEIRADDGTALGAHALLLRGSRPPLIARVYASPAPDARIGLAFRAGPDYSPRVMRRADVRPVTHTHRERTAPQAPARRQTIVTTTNELPFSREEYATRLDNVRRRMDAAGVEVLLTT